MKKNHFYISYNGNKRTEVEYIYNSVKDTISNYTTIIEPFCGTCAISYYIWKSHPDKHFVLNDNNRFLKEMFDIIKNNQEEEFNNSVNLLLPEMKESKPRYLEIVKQDNLIGWYVGHKFYNIMPKLYPHVKTAFIKPIDIRTSPICEFFKKANITFTTMDGLDCYTTYKNDSNNLIIIDPPYISSENGMYYEPTGNIYQYVFENSILHEPSKVVFILENIWIIRLLFNDLLEHSIVYSKKYNNTHKRTEHIIIKNK